MIASLAPINVWFTNTSFLNRYFQPHLDKQDNVMIWKEYAGPLWTESPGHRWIPFRNDQQCVALMIPLLLAWTSCWTYNRIIGGLRSNGVHLMSLQYSLVNVTDYQYLSSWITAGLRVLIIAFITTHKHTISYVLFVIMVLAGVFLYTQLINWYQVGGK